MKNAQGWVNQDRLGSIGKYFPYGGERPSATANGKEKFATYTRDAETGLDYAQNRYHSVGQGRFLTADPYQASAGLSDPGSWNRYAYVGGDPVNRNDPAGTCWVDELIFGTPAGPELIYGLAASGYGYDQLCNNLQTVFALDLSNVSGFNFLSFNYAYSPLGGHADVSKADCYKGQVNSVIDRRLQDIGLDLGVYQRVNTTVAGYTETDGKIDSQTGVQFVGGDWSRIEEQLKALGFKQSPDAMHGDESDSWRQDRGVYSLQVSHSSKTGSFTLDVDPHNPNGELLGHTWDVIRNTLTYSDTNYNAVADYFGYPNWGCD